MNIEENSDFFVVKLDLNILCNGLYYRLGKLIESLQVIIYNKNIQVEELREQVREQSAIIGTLCRNSKQNNNNERWDKYLCISCYNDCKSILFFPCLHIVYCENCAKKDKLMVCPICRKPITEKKNIFL